MEVLLFDALMFIFLIWYICKHFDLVLDCWSIYGIYDQKNSPNSPKRKHSQKNEFPRGIKSNKNSEASQIRSLVSAPNKQFWGRWGDASANNKFICEKSAGGTRDKTQQLTVSSQISIY